jgi:hypothetical protein
MGKTLDIIDSFPIKTKIREANKGLVLSDSGEVRNNVSLVCSIAATHAGTLINNRIYPPKSMKKGIKSWTTPYKKPVLVNHDEEKDPVGRVIKARYLKTPKGASMEDYKPILKASDGYGYIDLVVKITDQAAIEKIMDGRYETVSVRMSTNHAFCSICGADWADDGPCEHMPGKNYEDGGLAYITTGDLTYREVSFVNIPADEYARVEGLTFGEKKDSEEDPTEVSVYANNAEEKTLCNLEGKEGTNLYDYLKDETDEEEEVIVHLLDKIEKQDKKEKEDQMAKVEELTKDQLKEMDSVKELIQEALDGAKASADSDCEKQLEELKKQLEGDDCLQELEGLKKKLEDMKNDPNNEEVLKELGDAKDAAKAAQDAQIALSKEKEALETERDQLKEELDKRDKERDTLVDENVNLNSELHKLNAERLFDLKRSLGKPDVAGIETVEDREKKIDEFAQRSIDSLKDQLNDLLIEQDSKPDAIKPAVKVENPGIEHEDSGEKKEETKIKKNNETKGETLDRLFGDKGSE